MSDLSHKVLFTASPACFTKASGAKGKGEGVGGGGGKCRVLYSVVTLKLKWQ